MECSGLNETYANWYSLPNLPHILCKHCKNKYATDGNSHQVFDHKYPSICDGYKLIPNSITSKLGFEFSIWNSKLTEPVHYTNLPQFAYLYINNTLTKQYFSIIITIDGVIIQDDVQNCIMYKTDFICPIKTGKSNGLIRLNIEIHIYDIVPSKNIFSANVCLGDYCYNKKTNMITLIKPKSITNPSILYSIHPNRTHWNAESNFKFNSKFAFLFN
jgi:hypothetical protein